MEIKGNVVTKKDELTAVVDIFGTECKVHVRSIHIGGATKTPITQEDSEIVYNSSIEYPNGEIEIATTQVRANLSEVGLPDEVLNLLRKHFVEKVTEVPIVEEPII